MGTGLGMMTVEHRDSVGTQGHPGAVPQQGGITCMAQGLQCQQGWGQTLLPAGTELCPMSLQANLALWLSMIGLSQYYKVLVENGYENIDFITDITWEDLQEIGITKLGKVPCHHTSCRSPCPHSDTDALCCP